MAAKMVLNDAKAPLFLLRSSVLAAARNTSVLSNGKLIQALPITSQKPLSEPTVLRQYLFDIDSLKVEGSTRGYQRSAFGVEARGSRKVVDEDENDADDEDFDGEDIEDFGDEDEFDDDDGVELESDSDDDGKIYQRK